MKKIKLLVLIQFIAIGCLLAQAPPQGINYQAVARGTTGVELTNTALTVRVGIYSDNPPTTLAYEETHSVTTNAFGLFSLVIGQGTQTSSGAFNSILWANSAYYMKVEIDGGSGFTNMGTTQLMSVPYALFAGSSAGGPTGPTGPAGTIGATGPAGTNGTNGTNGATGVTGATGDGISSIVDNGDGTLTIVYGSTTIITSNLYGPTGAVGATGITGATGVAGPSGFDGATGATGPAGTNGTNGATGPAGPTGVAGTNGTNGATGPTGAAGTNGTNGVTGPTGANGTNGTNGATGPTGAAGTNGTNGTNGATGPTGAAGTNGVTGPTGPTWTLSTLSFNTNGTAVINGTAGSGGPITSTTGAWLTTGNSGTLPASNYIGTNDVQDFVVRTSALERIRVQAGGNVGVGINTPSAKFHTYGASGFQGMKVETGGGAGSGAFLDIFTPDNEWMMGTRNDGSFGASSNFAIADITPGILPRLVIDAAGNVGIGNNAPSYKLDVAGTGRYTGALTVGAYTLPNTDGTSNYVLKTNGAGTVSWQPDNNAGGTVTGSGTTNYLAKWTSASALTSSVVYDNGTNVLIGPGTPALIAGASRYLTVASTNVYSTDMAAIELAGSGTAATDVIGRMDFVQVLTGPAYQTNARVSGTRGGDLVFSTNPTPTLTERMRILASGNVGIGTTTPMNQIHIHGGASTTYSMWTNNATGQTNADGLILGLNGLGAGFLSYNEPNDFKIQMNGVNSIWMNSSGRIGLNGAPDASHTVLMYGSNEALGIDATGIVVGDVNGNSFGQYLSIPFENNSNFLMMGGNVGIGMTPTQKLSVNGNTSVAGNVFIPATNTYRYNTGKTKRYKISAMELNSVNPLYTARIDDGFSSATINGMNSLWASGGAAGTVAYFVAAVHLPDSAVITGLSAQLIKNGGSLQSIVELYRSDGSGYLTNTAQLIASATTSASGGIVWYVSAGSVNATYNVVDNSNYSYFIRYSGEQNTQNLRFINSTITYQIYRSDF